MPGGRAARVEVLNAGVTFTGPTCYLGMVRKHLDLAPDLVVAAPFTGNDFWNELWIARTLGGPPLEFGDPAYREPLEAVKERWTGPLAQGGNQAYRFAHHPEEAEEALGLAIDACLALRDLCAEHGIALLVVLVPTKEDADAGKGADELAEFHALLGLDAEAVALNRRLGERLLAALEAEGVPCIDPIAAMQAEPESLYWTTDYHLNVDGHRFLADLLAERIPALFPELVRGPAAGPAGAFGPH